EGDGGVVHFRRGPLGLRVNGQSERVDHKHDHHDVALEAAKLLGSQPEDVDERSHRHSSWLRKASEARTISTGMKQARMMASSASNRAGSPFVKAPTLACM